MLNFSFKGKNFHIVERVLISLIIALVVIGAGVGMMIAKGMNFGIEFSGGAIIRVELDTTATTFNEANFEKFVSDWLGGKNNAKKAYKVKDDPQEVGGGYEFRIGTTMTQNGKTYDLSEKIDDGKGSKQERLYLEMDYIDGELLTALEENLGDDSGVIVMSNHVGNDQVKKTIRDSAIAIAVAIVVILAYIAIRFTVLSGVAAILALCHDVLVMIAFTTIFQIPVNSTFIAAVITIIGYSINATIVVFDRIRELEKMPSYQDKTDKDIANEAITSTLTRSILTTLTTLSMISCLAIFGTATIREFAFPIIFGLVAGAFSSVLLSAPIWVLLRKLFKQANKKPNLKKAKA